MDGFIDQVWGNDGGDRECIRQKTSLQIDIAINQSALCDNWLGELGRDVVAGRFAHGSWMSVRRDLRPWIIYLETVARTDAPQAQHVKEYIQEQVDRHSTSTVNNRHDALTGLYSWAASVGRYANITIGSPRLPDEIRTLPRLVNTSVQEVLALMPKNSELELRNRAIVSLLAEGLETVSLHRAVIADYDRAKGQFRHQPRHHTTKDVVITLSSRSTETLDEYLRVRNRRAVDGTGVGYMAPLFTSNIQAVMPLSTLSMRLIVNRLSAFVRVVHKAGLTTTALRNTGTLRLCDDQNLQRSSVTAGIHVKSMARLMRRLQAHPQT